MSAQQLICGAGAVVTTVGCLVLIDRLAQRPANDALAKRAHVLVVVKSTPAAKGIEASSRRD